MQLKNAITRYRKKAPYYIHEYIHELQRNLLQVS